MPGGQDITLGVNPALTLTLAAAAAVASTEVEELVEGIAITNVGIAVNGT